jgi:hypothetical protein
MTKRELLNLIEIIKNQLIICQNYEESDISNFDPNFEYYFPTYLIGRLQYESRIRAYIYLNNLAEIIISNRLKYSKEMNLSYNVLLLAILYCEWKRKPLFEEDAAKIVEMRFTEDKLNGIELLKRLNFIEIKRNKGKRTVKEITNNIDKYIQQIATLIKYHKIACTVLGYRLSDDMYSKICNELESNSLNIYFMGLMAASCYDSPRNNGTDISRKRRKKIIKMWKSKGIYINDTKNSKNERLDHVPILYDLPLCDVDEKTYCRLEYNKNILKRLLIFWEDSNIRNKNDFYMTINYRQSHILPLEDNIVYKNLIDETIGLEKNYQFVKIKNSNKDIFEFRFKKSEAIASLLGLKVNDNHNFEYNNLNWLDAIFDIATKIFEKDSLEKNLQRTENYYPIPIKNYFPLPLLNIFFNVVYDYSKSIIDNDDSIDDLEEINYNITGQKDTYFPKNFLIRVPNREVLIKNDKFLKVLPTIEKYLASFYTNIGICAGFDQNIITRNSWSKRINEILTNDTFGYELLIKYIETFMRSHDVRHSTTNLVNSNEYNKILKAISNKNPKEKENSQEYRNDFIKTSHTVSIGIDIGAGSIKFKIYSNSEIYKKLFFANYKKNSRDYNRDYRILTSPKAGEKYKSLNEFANHLLNGIRKLIEINKLTESLDIDVIGVCWPGAIRDQKIAGASKILGYFDDSVASNWIRKNLVEKIRVLDLIEELKTLINEKSWFKDKIDTTKTTIGLCNDGYAEALGRLINVGGSEHKWAILKLGTGTAGCIFKDYKINDGMMEFGKLILNVYIDKDSYDKDFDKYSLNKDQNSSKNLLPELLLDKKILKLFNVSHSEPTKDDCTETYKYVRKIVNYLKKDIHDVGHDKTPDGDINKYASTQLLPNVFQSILSNNTGKIEITSFEIGKISEFILKGKSNITENTFYKLIREIGIERIYCDKYEHLLSKGEFLDFYNNKSSISADIKDQICKVIGLNNNVNGRNHIKKIVYEIGNERIITILSHIINNDIKNLHSKDLITLITRSFDDINNFFIELYSRAGSHLSDAIMLLYEYYKMNGVIICGGVIKNDLPTEKLISSIKLHLNNKYFIKFEDYKQFLLDQKLNVIDKKSSTIYHNFPPIEMIGKKKNRFIYDQGELGAIYHAKLIQLSNSLSERKNTSG